MKKVIAIILSLAMLVSVAVIPSYANEPEQTTVTTADSLECAFAEGTKETLDDPNRSLAIDLFMKHPIESVKKLAFNLIELYAKMWYN